jgi:hypothetical protein
MTDEGRAVHSTWLRGLQAAGEGDDSFDAQADADEGEASGDGQQQDTQAIPVKAIWMDGQQQAIALAQDQVGSGQGTPTSTNDCLQQNPGSADQGENVSRHPTLPQLATGTMLAPPASPLPAPNDRPIIEDSRSCAGLYSAQ